MKISFAVILLFSFLTIICPHLLSSQVNIPHRKDCYTQGLFFINATHLFESCGLYNESFFYIMKYTEDPFTLEQVYVSQIPWKHNIFLEGATLFKNHIYVMTWKEKIVYKLSLDLQLISQLPWKSQGWGLTHNNTHMFTTDGSDKVYVVDQDFKVLEQKRIKNKNGQYARYLNELEYVDGYIYCNIYFDRFIHKIDYAKGQIVESYDGITLYQKQRNQNKLKQDEVFNGIAYNHFSRKFILTGKKWSTIYQVDF